MKTKRKIVQIESDEQFYIVTAALYMRRNIKGFVKVVPVMEFRALQSIFRVTDVAVAHF